MHLDHSRFRHISIPCQGLGAGLHTQQGDSSTYTACIAGSENKTERALQEPPVPGADLEAARNARSKVVLCRLCTAPVHAQLQSTLRHDKQVPSKLPGSLPVPIPLPAPVLCLWQCLHWACVSAPSCMCLFPCLCLYVGPLWAAALLNNVSSH